MSLTKTSVVPLQSERPVARITSAASALADESLGLPAAREMRRRWRNGERPTAKEFLDHQAELRDCPEAAIDVIYEEFCLRQAADEQNVEQDLLRRFPQWGEPLRVMFDCHRVLQPDGAAPDYPTAGDTIAGFRLIEDLGRGARGRVYLATQTDLSSRPVVLKLTPLDGAEHLLLARLQHTHIVPVYSVADDTERNVRSLCMPYFGRATLASVLTALANVPLTARTGQHIVTAIDTLNASSDEPATGAAARQMLAHVSSVQAACWIAACLADALQYAHEHNLVHLDVKPSNVLLASDGQPMLLDFHLACEPMLGGGELPDRIGGTLGYMPPEQVAAMRALPVGRTIEQSVDARADIFALGVVLHELLTGTLPTFTTGISSRTDLCRENPQVSTGLSDIVVKCLAPNAEDRYASAAALADDLRRHLADQPLAGVHNRSLTERLHKWRRRKPHALRLSGMLAVVFVATALVLGSLDQQWTRRKQDASQALADAEQQLRTSRPDEAVRTLERGLSLAQSLPFHHDIEDRLRRQLVIARRQHLTAELHQLADRVRTLSDSDLPIVARQHRLANLCHQLWEQRHFLAGRLASEARIQPAQHIENARHGHVGDDVTLDLLDVAIFWARLQRRAASDSNSARNDALRTLDQAAELFGTSPVLDLERQLCQDQPLPALSQLLPHNTGSAKEFTAWEHYALGRALLGADRLDEAATELDAARALAPAGLWPNFYFGLCAHRQGRHTDAVAAFSVCIGANPNLAAPYFNRAVSHLALGHTSQAERDFAQARQLDPSPTTPNRESHPSADNSVSRFNR